MRSGGRAADSSRDMGQAMHRDKEEQMRSLTPDGAAPICAFRSHSQSGGIRAMD